MASRKRVDSRRAKRTSKKTKLTKPKYPKAAKSMKKVDHRKSSSVTSQIEGAQFANVQAHVQERYIVTVENIRGDTSIGDLLVFFPRTREVLARKGLRLEAEDAGDIYMTLDVFSAMNGIEIRGLVQEIVEVAKEPAIPQSTPQVVVPAVP